MAISGHHTLTEVQRYTEDANRRVLADSAMAKRAGRTENTALANPGAETGKPASKSLKNNS